ncbi:glycosyltransferase family 2 protein [Paenibacillus sp. PL91]|uniref:glycosyltransferase family 2 protein n=1 Tax=Paenibacillus sp. PL91 TaxID=2729538 RepID=UPI001CB88CF7|nr:glycosyltransferase family 2 protein [Paenibacillus sp. PL91]
MKKRGKLRASAPRIPRDAGRMARWGREAGQRDAASNPLIGQGDSIKLINRLWAARMRTRTWSPMAWPRYHAAAKGYLQGICQKNGLPYLNRVLMPTDKSVAVIMTVMNEEDTIPILMMELNRLVIDELIIVVNGSKDQSFTKARELSKATILYYPEPLGHDVGRSIGAKVAKSDILVFIDGDIPLQAEQLIPFVYAVEKGMDVALNNVNSFLPIFSKRDAVSHVKEFLNRSLRRPDLKTNSLTTVPHALSRRAVDRIGYDHLAVPPKAHARAILEELRVGAPFSVNVIAANRRRAHNASTNNPVAEMIIGDHVEALSLSMSLKTKRLSFPDPYRMRSRLQGGRGNE